MRAFEHASPATAADVVRLMAEAPQASVILAGGTDLLALMKDDVLTPRRVVSLRAVPGLDAIDVAADGGLRIGALVTLEALRADARLAAACPAVVQAAASIHSPQVRNVATLGGNLCQWPRCWYFRSGFGLLAQRDGRSMVRDGDNRYHAVLGNGGAATYVHPSSLAPTLMVLGARAVVLGPSATREVPVAELYRIPQSDVDRPHVLAPAELLTHVVLPPSARRKSAFYEVRQRQVLDWPLASAAAAFDLTDGRIRSPRLALAHVAPIPWAVPEAERILDGASPEDAATLARAAEAAVAGASPLGQNAYKVQLARVALRRAVLRAAGKEA